MIRLFPPSPRDIEALRAQEAARRRADDPNITSRSGFGRPQIRPLSAQERHQQREDARAERSFQQRQQRQQARAQQTQQAVTDYRAGEREQRPPTPVEQYRTGERDSFVAPLAPVVTEANQLPVSMPGEDDASWNNWLISEKWGNELSTDQAVSLFLGYVTGNYDIEADDVATLQALEVIVRETVGDVIDTNSALYLLQQSGALDGRGFSAYTLDYLINQSSIVMGSGQTIPPEVIEAIVSANLGILSAEELAHLEALTGLTTEQANLVRNEAAWVQSTLVNELYAMVSAGLLSEDIVPYLNQDLDNRSNVNLGILVALYQEGLEKAGSNSPYLHQPGTELPVMFFASQHNNLYPEGTPYGEHLLIAMSFFPVLDQVAAAIDFIRSVAAGDRLGAALALMSFLPGPNLGAFDDIVEGVARNADEIVEGVARNADEVVDGARHVPVPTALPPLTINEHQFGSHASRRHMSEWGLDVSNADHRAQFRTIIQNIVANADEVRQGAFRPQSGGGTDYLFFRLGNDVVVTKANGEFVSIWTNGVTNSWFVGASVIP
jgi:hypothetical protein